MSEPWSFLDGIAADLGQTASHDLGPGVSTILADRLITALSAGDRDGLDVAQAALEHFYLERLAQAPEATLAAARGEDQASSEASAFALGQIGFAHALAARAAARRVDADFEKLLCSPEYESYIRLLINTELSGTSMAEQLGKDEAVVSKKLKVLREKGAVDCRREGTRLVNFLTPAARAVVHAHNMGAIGDHAERAFPLAVSDALADKRGQLLPTNRQALLMVVRGDQRSRL